MALVQKLTDAFNNLPFVKKIHLKKRAKAFIAETAAKGEETLAKFENLKPQLDVLSAVNDSVADMYKKLAKIVKKPSA